MKVGDVRHEEMLDAVYLLVAEPERGFFNLLALSEHPQQDGKQFAFYQSISRGWLERNTEAWEP